MSAGDQDVAGQALRLTQAGAARVFTGVRSGRSIDWPGLQQLLAYARNGDTPALVSPADSLGFMDGGMTPFAAGLWPGTTGDDTHPDLIAAPTTRVPMLLDGTTINPFLATRVALPLVRYGAVRVEPLAGVQVRSRIQTAAFSGMGAGVGQGFPARCARQMRAAFDQAKQAKTRISSSRAKASEACSYLFSPLALFA